MTRTEFQAVVERAVASLPERFARHLAHVEVVIEDAPSRATLRDLGLDPRRDTLFGLYEGLTLADRIGALLPLPDRIVIYYKPLVQSFHSPQRIQREIEKTVIHEIGHAFGLEDEEMDE